MKERILGAVSDYYEGKIEEFGATPAGVDWNGRESQETRFEQLAKIVPDLKVPFSIDDYGCGYGELIAWLEARGAAADYLGIDIAPKMVEKARELHGDRFAAGSVSPRKADYAVASGILNVKLATGVEEWEDHVRTTLESMHERCVRGFAFNCLTSYSDKEYMRDDLYYADPAVYFEFCKRNFSRNVALLHDYELYEFTILVRKT